MAERVAHDLDMVVDIVDDHDVPVGQVRRSALFNKKANFRVAHVLIFNSTGNLLVQQLAPNRERHPLQWGTSVAAYVPAGDTYHRAAVDRVEQELGINGLTMVEFKRTMMIDNGRRKFVAVFTATYDGSIRLDSSHIAAVKFASVEELIRMSASNKLTPTFLHIMRASFSD